MVWVSPYREEPDQYVHAQSQREESWWSWLKGILNIWVTFVIITYPMLQHQPANHKGIQVHA